MHPSRAARLATAAVPTAVSAVVTGWLLSTAHWSWWGLATMVPTNPETTSFADLKAILATSLCMQQAVDYTTCDPYGRPFTPYVVLPARILAFTGRSLDDATALGIALAVVLVVTVAALGLVLAAAWRGRLPGLIVGQFVLALAAITAPVMLAVERGQVEIITLALAVVALLALSRDRIGWRITGAVAAVIAVASKFFAVGVFAPFLRRGRINWLAVAALAASLVFLVGSWSDLSQAAGTSRTDEPATSRSQFGAMALIATLLSSDPITGVPASTVVEHWSWVRVGGWAITLTAILIAAFALPTSVIATLDGAEAARVLVIGSAGILALPYVLGASHDYRQVFLLPLIVGALLWASAASGAARWIPALVAAAALVSLLTGASMILTPSDSMWHATLMWPKTGLVAGDLALLFVLAVGGGAWVRGWAVRRA